MQPVSALDDPVFDAAGEHESVTLVKRAIDIIASAKPLPLSSSVRVEPDELLELLERSVERLPEELRQARWLLKERDEFLAKVQREGDDILDAARARAERLVARQDVVREAKRQAQATIDAADAHARQMQHEAEDWCDQQLAKLEIVIDRISKTAQAGREKLRVNLMPSEDHLEAAPELAEDYTSANFFDQGDE